MSDNGGHIVGWIVGGGGGAILGSLIVTGLQVFGRHGRDRGEAADLATSASARMLMMYGEENARMREAIVAITEVLDSVIEDLPIDSPAKAKLRKVNRVARLSMNPSTAPRASSV